MIEVDRSIQYHRVIDVYVPIFTSSVVAQGQLGSDSVGPLWCRIQRADSRLLPEKLDCSNLTSRFDLGKGNKGKLYI